MVTNARWLQKLERSMQWLAVPNLAVIFVTLQALGFLMVMSEPAWFERLALLPSAVLVGEAWRLVTFLALPLSMSPIWVIFSLMFLWFLLNTLEQEWGEFKTTLYVLTSIVITIAFSLAFSYPVTSVSHFESTLFLAVATLFPEMEIRVYFAIPVKMKWLAWLSLGFVALEAFRGGWIDRLYLVAIYSNFLLFFGPAQLDRIRQLQRRRRYRRGL
jgi:membrane associated rhomboid family serine protease